MSYRIEFRQTTHESMVGVDATCDGCGTRLKPVYGEVDGSTRLAGGDPLNGWENALRIQFIGGYREYFDGVRKNAVLCQGCATILLEMFPKLKGIVHD